MDNIDSKNGAIDKPASLSERFGWECRDWFIILAVVLFAGTWVIVHGFFNSSEGLLGRPLRVGIVAWPGYAGGLMANNGLLPNKDSDFWRNRNLLVKFVQEEDDHKLHEKFV